MASPPTSTNAVASETYQATGDGVVLGYIALKVSDDRGHILDVLARPDRDDVVCSLLERAADRFREAEVRAAECWIPPKQSYRRRRRNGHFDTRRDSGISVSTFPGEHENDVDCFKDKDPNVHLILGDVDNV